MPNLSHITKDIKGITADSRAVQPGFLFAALPGVKSDGCDFINDAIANGATHILLPLREKVPPKGADEGLVSHTPHPAASQPPSPYKGEGITFIESDSPRKTFALLAAEFYGAQPETIFAVTGTNGKTSTVNILRQLWEGLGHNAAAIGTLGVIGTNYSESGSLTTPDPVKLHRTFARLVEHTIQHAAIEASSHGIDQERLSGVKLSAGIFTNLTQDHLDYHSTMENYFGAKARLFSELLPDGAPAAINADDEYGQKLIEMCSKRLRVCSFGAQGKDLQLLNYRARPDGFDVQIKYQDKEYDFYLPLLGKFQIWNVMGVLGSLLLAGEKMEKLLPLIAKLQPVRGRLELVGRSAAGAPIFVDYAHTPDALKTVLESVREHAQGRLTVVFGCGGDRDKGKRPKMGAIAMKFANRVIVTDDNPRTENAATIRAEVMGGAAGAREIGDRREAIHTAIAELAAGDILVIAGKGHEQGQIVGDKIIPFDDATVAQEFLRSAA